MRLVEGSLALGRIKCPTTCLKPDTLNEDISTLYIFSLNSRFLSILENMYNVKISFYYDMKSQ